MSSADHSTTQISTHPAAEAAERQQKTTQRLQAECLFEQTRIVDQVLRKRVVGQNAALETQAKRLVIEGAVDLQFGARPLRRAFESAVVDPVSRMIATRALRAGDVLEVRREDNALVFFRTSGEGLVA